MRHRYVDLIVNPEARRMAEHPGAVLRSIRDDLHERGFLEVETPVLQAVHGGANARPFITHINAYNMELYLRIALELYLKRLVVGGIERVYEIGRIFRNEGADSTHNPEFTMLEAYEAYGDYDTMADLTRELIQDAARRPVSARRSARRAGGEYRPRRRLAGQVPCTARSPRRSARRSTRHRRGPAAQAVRPARRAAEPELGPRRRSSWRCTSGWWRSGPCSPTFYRTSRSTCRR